MFLHQRLYAKINWRGSNAAILRRKVAIGHPIKSLSTACYLADQWR